MAKRTYVANAPLVAQVDRIQISAEQYLAGRIAEGSDLKAIINDKAIVASVPSKEGVGPGGALLATNDADAVRALLNDLYEKWSDSDIPEFQEIECSAPQQNDNGDWFVDLTAKEPGVPFLVDIEAPFPTIDVDTVREGGPGESEVQSFYLSPVPEAGEYRILWDLGNGVESSGLIPFDGDLAAVRLAMTTGMASLTEDNFVLTGAGTVESPFVVALKGDLESRSVPPLMIEATNLEGNGDVFISTINNGSAGSSDTVAAVMWQTNYYPDLMVYTSLGTSLLTGWSASDTSATMTAKLEALSNVGAGNIEAFVSSTDPGRGRAIGYRFKGALGGQHGGRLIPQLYTGESVAYTGYVAPGAQSQQPSAYFMTTTGTGGTFTVTVDGEESDPIPYNAGNGVVHAAIVGLAGLESGDLIVVGYQLSSQNPLKTWAMFFDSDREVTIEDASVTGGAMTLDTMSTAETSTGVNDRQAIYTNGLSGTFTLTKPGGSTSGGLSPLSSTDQIKTAVEALYGGTWTVTGSGTPGDPWILEAGGALAGTDVVQMTGSGTNLLGASRGIVETVTEGSVGVYELWSVAINGASGGTFSLSFRDHRTAEIAFGAAASAVESALEALDNLTSCTVTGVGTIESPYLVEIADPDYESTNIRQLVAHNEKLTGAGYPIVVHETIAAAEGPWHWNLPLNWWNCDAGGYGIPQDGDDLYFESGSDRRCPRYDLDQSELTVVGLTFLANFTDNATVGLPRWNPLGYWEYRETTLKINLSGDGPITVGSRGGGGSPLMNFNTFNSKTTFRIHNTASPIAGESSAIQWEGTNAASSVEILGGFFGAAVYAGQVATLAKITQRDGSVLTGAGCSIGDIDKTAGDLLMDRSPVSGVMDIQG